MLRAVECTGRHDLRTKRGLESDPFAPTWTQILTRTPDLYRVKGSRTSFTTTYMATGDCQVPAKTCKTEQSWVEPMGPNRLQISACRVLLYLPQSLRNGLLSRDA
jgi:hypothetical protein